MLQKIKTKLMTYFKRHKVNTQTEYTDLAPIDEIDNADEYFKALEWVMNNERIKNIALAGPYGAGKSSIIETYLKKHPITKKKSLRISMATFEKNAVDNSKDDKKDDKKIGIAQSKIELEILKQLFYKVAYNKIPQSRYRKLHKISSKNVYFWLGGLSGILFVFTYIFSNRTFNFVKDKIVTAGSSINFLLQLLCYLLVDCKIKLNT